MTRQRRPGSRRAALALAAGIAASPLLSAPPPAEDQPRHPSTLYLEHCARCHGPRGDSETHDGRTRGAEVFNDKLWQMRNRSRVEQLIRAVAEGRGTKMPAFRDRLTPAQVRSLVEKDVLGPWK